MIDRRAVVLLAAMVAVAVGVSAAVYTQSADAADVNANIQPQQLTVEGESDDGQVEALYIEFDGSVEWSGFEHGVSEIGVYPPGDSYVYGYPENFDPNATSGTFDFSESGQGNPSVYIPADRLDGNVSVDEDGATEMTTVPVNVTVTVSGPEEAGDTGGLGNSATTSVVRDVQIEVTNLPDEGTEMTVTANLDWNASLQMAS